MATAPLTIERLPGSIYQYGNLSVVPHPSDYTLAFNFIRFEKEGLLDTIFHEWVPPLEWILHKYKQPENTVLGLTVQEDGIWKQAGLAWIDRLVSSTQILKRADVGAALFREFHGRPFEVAVPLMHLATDWAFREMNFDTIGGVTPVPNKSMAVILRRVGYRQCRVEQYTTFRGLACDGIISTMTKDRWFAEHA